MENENVLASWEAKQNGLFNKNQTKMESVLTITDKKISVLTKEKRSKTYFECPNKDIKNYSISRLKSARPLVPVLLFLLAVAVIPMGYLASYIFETMMMMIPAMMISVSLVLFGLVLLSPKNIIVIKITQYGRSEDLFGINNTIVNSTKGFTVKFPNLDKETADSIFENFGKYLNR